MSVDGFWISQLLTDYQTELDHHIQIAEIEVFSDPVSPKLSLLIIAEDPPDISFKVHDAAADSSLIFLTLTIISSANDSRSDSLTIMNP